MDDYILPQIDIEAQLNIIRHVIDSKYDGLAIVPYDSERITEALKEAMEKGIEVVTFNNQDRNLSCCYIGHDGFQSGRTAGNHHVQYNKIGRAHV